MDKRIYVWMLGLCLGSVLLGVGLGYLVFGGARVSATIYTGAVGFSEEQVGSKDGVGEVLPGLLYELGDEAAGYLYLVTVMDGFVAVMYACGEVKEVTTIPTNTLPAADMAFLEQGIRIYTDEALARILQDYGS